MSSARSFVALFVLTLLGLLSPTSAQAQEFTTIPEVTAPSSTTVSNTVADTVTDTETQTVVEAEPQQDRFLTSESRRIVAAIGGLVAVALLLMLLTIRYWRQTKPTPPVSDADHVTADETWEPLATGEHAQVDLPDSGRRPRPDTEARRKALGRT